MKIAIKGFGTFSVKKRAEKKGRHPKTGEELLISARSVPAFSAGSDLKDVVANPKKKAAPAKTEKKAAPAKKEGAKDKKAAPAKDKKAAPAKDKKAAPAKDKKAAPAKDKKPKK
jgi:hypothetical protein